MSFLNIIGNGISELFGGQTAKQAALRQFELQSKLNQQQQDFARVNALTEYQRQRELTSDNYMLQLQGIKNAGMNAAMLGGSSTPSLAHAPAIAAPSSGSAVQGSSDVGNVTSVLSLLTSAFASFMQGKSQKEKLPLEKENIGADTDKKLAETQLVHENATGQHLANEVSRETLNVQIDKAFADFDNVQAATAKTEEERQLLQHQSDQLKLAIKQSEFDVAHLEQRWKNENAQVNASIKQLKAAANQADAQAALTNVEKRFKDMGLGISNNFLGTAIAVLGSGNTKLFENAVSTLKQLFIDSGVPQKIAFAVADKVSEAVHTAKDKVKKTKKDINRSVDNVRSKVPDNNGFGVPIGSTGSMP